MRAAAAIFTVAVLLGACGDDDDGLARTVTTTTPTTVEDGSTTSSTAAGEGVAGSGDPEAILLTIEDMPTGWSVAPDDETEPEEGTEDCFTEAAGEFDDEPDAEVQFQQGNFLPFVGAGVTVHDGDDAAGVALDALAEGFSACDGYTQTEDDGTETTWAVQPLSFPDLGDDTFATRMRADSDFGSIVIDIVATRVGSALIFLTHASLGDVDTELTEQLQRTMVERA